MNKYWSDSIRHLHAYVPGEQPRIRDLVKLNTNENPYPPSPRVLDALRAASDDGLRLYPDPEAASLRAVAAARVELEPANVFVGNGSDEVLAHTFRALLKQSRPILFPDITYSFYPLYCDLFDIAYETVPLDDALAVRPADYRRPNGGVIVPNPNAPTGGALSRAAIAELAAANADRVVVIDEAYVDFGAESAVPLVASTPNLLVIQTLSKARSLAGLRVGFAYADAGLIAALELVKGCFNSYPLDALALAGAEAALTDEAYYADVVARIVASRERVATALSALGFEVRPSKANFLFVRHPAHRGAALMQALRERAILVRHFDRPRISDYLRITIGTDAECDRLLEALGDIVGG
ncbi:MAG: histidinol-phosphate transaminase [Gammaproteobacteria bacterium]